MIGIYGGTFDPIHLGHLRPALEILEALHLEQLRFIPCGQPPHRQPAVASGAQRLAMLQLAIAGQSGFVADDRELQRVGPSYMLDTLRSLRQEFPGKMLCLVIGTDVFATLHRWHQWRDVVECASLLVTHRAEFDVAQLRLAAELAQWRRSAEVFEQDEFLQASAGRVLFYPVSQLAISSSAIREHLQQGRSIRYWVPQSVYDYIRHNRIY